MNDFTNILTSMGAIIVYIILLTILAGYIVYCINKKSHKKRLTKHNTKELNRLVDEIELEKTRNNEINTLNIKSNNTKSDTDLLISSSKITEEVNKEEPIIKENINKEVQKSININENKIVNNKEIITTNKNIDVNSSINNIDTTNQINNINQANNINLNTSRVNMNYNSTTTNYNENISRQNISRQYNTENKPIENISDKTPDLKSQQSTYIEIPSNNMMNKNIYTPNNLENVTNDIKHSMNNNINSNIEYSMNNENLNNNITSSMIKKNSNLIDKTSSININKNVDSAKISNTNIEENIKENIKAKQDQIELLSKDDEIEELEYTTIEPQKEEAKKELELITEKLKQESLNNDLIEHTDFEDEQEKNAIISMDELMQKASTLYEKNEETQYKDEGNEPISIEDLEREMKRQKEEIMTINIEEINPFPEKEEILEITEQKEEIPHPIYETKKENKVILEDFSSIKINKDEKKEPYNEHFKTSPVISPVYGITNAKKEIYSEKTDLELENTANYEKLDEEIRKTNEFLATLKELQNKLD